MNVRMRTGQMAQPPVAKIKGTVTAIGTYHSGDKPCGVKNSVGVQPKGKGASTVKVK